MDPAAGDLDSRVVRYRLHGLNSGIGGQAENGMRVSQITSICSYELIPPLFRERCVSSQPERRRWPEIVAESTTLRGEQLRLAWAELLGCLAWERMVTLTSKSPATKRQVRSEVTKWCDLIGYSLRTPVGWLGALE